MTTLTALLVTVGLLAVLVAGLRPAFHAGVAHRRCQDLAQRAGLELDALTLDAVRPRLTRRSVVGTVGGVLAGAGIAAWYTATLSDLHGAVAALVWTAVAVVLGRAIALCAVAVADGLRMRPTTTGPRVARVIAPRLGDYLHPREAALAAVLALAPGALLVAWLVHPAGPDAAPLFPAVIGLGALVLGAVTAHRLLHGTRRATTGLGLAWDDALRARALRDLAAAIALLGVSYALLSTSMYALVPTTPASRDTVSTWATALLWAPAAAALALALAAGPGGRFQRRLWPESPRPAEQVTS